MQFSSCVRGLINIHWYESSERLKYRRLRRISHIARQLPSSPLIFLRRHDSFIDYEYRIRSLALGIVTIEGNPGIENGSRGAYFESRSQTLQFIVYTFWLQLKKFNRLKLSRETTRRCCSHDCLRKRRNRRVRREGRNIESNSNTILLPLIMVSSAITEDAN